MKKEIEQAIQLASKSIEKIIHHNAPMASFLLMALSTSSTIPLEDAERCICHIPSNRREDVEDAIFAIREYINLVSSNDSNPNDIEDDIITVEIDTDQDTSLFLGSPVVPELPSAVNENGEIVDIQTCIKEGVSFGKVFMNRDDFYNFSSRLEACFGPVPLKYNGFSDSSFDDMETLLKEV